MTTEEYPTRKRPVHGVKRGVNDFTIVLVTACTKNRETWLANHEYHSLLEQIWQRTTDWLVGRYVLMPDHLHLFASPGTRDISLERWMKHWKSLFSLKKEDPEHRWQAGHWDRRLRSGESYEEKWEYVCNNPVRHGLVQHAEDWPFQGEIHLLDWL